MTQSVQTNCWYRIGVQGDRSCPELQTVIHCQNCPVYSHAGRGLLERPAPAGYVAEWTHLLAQPPDSQPADPGETLTANIFRLGQEWLALPASIFNQVLVPSPIHSLPHSTNPVLRGIVNVRGQLLLCISLHALLGIEGSNPDPANIPPLPVIKCQPGSYPRLVVIEQPREVWAFEVDEIYGLHQYSTGVLRNAPTLSSKTVATFVQGILPWRDRNVSCLNADRLFEALRQQAL